MTGIHHPETPQGLSLKITHACRNVLITTQIAKIGEIIVREKQKPGLAPGLLRDNSFGLSILFLFIAVMFLLMSTRENSTQLTDIIPGALHHSFLSSSSNDSINACCSGVSFQDEGISAGAFLRGGVLSSACRFFFTATR